MHRRGGTPFTEASPRFLCLKLVGQGYARVCVGGGGWGGEAGY